MRKLKQILAIAMVVMMGVVFMPMVPGVNGVAKADTEGWQSFGTNCKYKIETTGSGESQEVTLTIAKDNPDNIASLPYDSEITDASKWPWHSERANITNVVIDDSISAGIFSVETTTDGTTAYMFSGCSKLKSINLDGLDTNFTVNMESMFAGCKALTKLDLAGFYTPKVTNMASMFNGCESLTQINASDNFYTGNVTNSTDMFAECTSLKGGEGTEFDSANVDKTYAHIDGGQENKGYFTQEFGTCTWSITNDGTYTILTIEPAKGTSGTLPGYKAMIWPWYGKNGATAKTITKVVIDDGVNPGNSTAYMFDCCEKLTSLDVSNFDTSNVTNMSDMFHFCKNLTSLDVSNFNTSKVTNMVSMFDGCEKLTSLDVSKFDTKNVTKMSDMFYGCEKLTSLDVSNFDTSNVTNMSDMFYGCKVLERLDVSKFVTTKVTTMASMFNGCSKLKSLDVSKFNTSNVTRMANMFNGCSELTTIYASDKFVIIGIAEPETTQSSSTNMFKDCSKLVGGAGTTYVDANPKDKTYARIDGGTDSETPGYFTGVMALKGKAQHDAGGTVASALTKSTARQPEAASKLIAAANTAYTAISNTNSDGKAQGIGETGAALLTSMARQPKVAGKMMATANTTYTAISNTNSDGKALGIGETGAALLSSIARQPEVEDYLKTAAADIYKYINGARNDGQAIGIGKVGAALMDGIARQPGATETLKEIADESAGKIKSIRYGRKAQATGEVYAGLIKATARDLEKKDDFVAEANAILSNIYKIEDGDRMLATAKIKGASLAAHASLEDEGYKEIIDQAVTDALTEIGKADDGDIAISMGEMGARTLNTIVENRLSKEAGWNVIHAGITTMIQGELSIAKSSAKARAMVEAGTGLIESVADDDEITGEALTTIESDAMEICQKINRAKSDDIALAIGKLGAGELKALACKPDKRSNIKKEAKAAIGKISSMRNGKRAVGYGAVAGGLIEYKVRQPEAISKLEAKAELCYVAIYKKATDASEGIGTMGAGSLEAIARQPEAESTISAEMNLFIWICADRNVEPTPTPTPATEYTVTFDNQGHGAVPQSQKVEAGDKVSDPGSLKADGYTFGGWFADKACTKAWNFDKDIVSKNMTLYAKWTENTAIEDCNIVLSNEVYVFNNKIQVPNVTVTDPSGKILEEDKDYKFEIEDSKNVGTYAVTVEGIGLYKGGAQASYVINPAPKAIKTVTAGKKKLTVKWKKSSKAYLAQTTGYQIKVSASKSFEKSKAVYAKATSTSSTIKGLKAHKKYYVKMRAYKTVDGQKYWSEWSKVNVKKTK